MDPLQANEFGGDPFPVQAAPLLMQEVPQEAGPGKTADADDAAGENDQDDFDLGGSD